MEVEGGEEEGKKGGWWWGVGGYLLPSSYPTILPLTVFFLNRKAFGCRVAGQGGTLT